MSTNADMFAGLKSVTGDWPDLNTEQLPQDERRAARWIQESLMALSGYASDFGAALRLFDESFNAYAVAAVTGTTNDGLARLQIAARDGAVTIFNFARTVEGLKGSLFAECPTLSAHIDHNQLRAARKLLKECFPDFAPIRHAVAHAAELREEGTKHQAEAVIGDVFPTLLATPWANTRTKMTLRGVLQDRKFISTFDGRVRTYEVTAATLANLNKVKDSAFAAFARCPTVTK